jgi:hypothetical protein
MRTDVPASNVICFEGITFPIALKLMNFHAESRNSSSNGENNLEIPRIACCVLCSHVKQDLKDNWSNIASLTLNIPET